VKRVSVIIPTCNRLGFLRTALKSVESQTARDAILEVVVVENSGRPDSKSVCIEFPKMPITYIFRDPPLKPENAGRDLLSQGRGEFTAILCDDDWWDPLHIQAALEAFDVNIGLVGVYCGYFPVRSEADRLHCVSGSFVPWFASSTPIRKDLWTLTCRDMVVSCLIATGFHYSTLVVCSSILRKCLHIYDYGNPYDTDRMLSFELAKLGPVGCCRTPRVYCREHSGQETRRVELFEEARHWFSNSTERILKYAFDNGIDLENEFQSRAAIKGIPLVELLNHSNHETMRTLVQSGRLGTEVQDLAAMSDRKRRTRDWIPPNFLRYLKKISKFLNKHSDRSSCA
jgi:glycosyltransferase involved in cell wall biosynthesis